MMWDDQCIRNRKPIMCTSGPGATLGGGIPDCRLGLSESRARYLGLDKHVVGGSPEAQIPGASGGESIEFKVEATDSKGSVSETGSDSDDLPNCRMS